MNFLRRWWNAYRRQYDHRILWPIIKKEALKRGGTIDDARNAFMLHTRIDPAWADLSMDERWEIVDHYR